MNTERQKVTEALQAFSNRLDKATRSGRPIILDWRACGVLWSYLDPAVEMLKADSGNSVSPVDGTERQKADEGVSFPKAMNQVPEA